MRKLHWIASAVAGAGLLVAARAPTDAPYGGCPLDATAAAALFAKLKQLRVDGDTIDYDTKGAILGGRRPTEMYAYFYPNGRVKGISIRFKETPALARLYYKGTSIGDPAHPTNPQSGHVWSYGWEPADEGGVARLSCLYNE